MKWARKNLAKSLKADLTAGIKPLENWPDVNVFLDMESVSVHDMIEGYKYFPELQAHYPDALFILNTRNSEACASSDARTGCPAHHRAAPPALDWQAHRQGDRRVASNSQPGVASGWPVTPARS